ncbi:MAG: DUF255 domain-containing protein, partial [Bacteroidia bacterium]|nr:DUF255 domain-containing protein [Bacteroidia bacterium]
MRKLAVLILFVATTLLASIKSSEAQPLKSPGQINWMTIQEAAAAFNNEPRKIFVDVYTDWCGWCKKMDATTFKDADVADYINNNFYAIKLNAEMKDSIIFNQTLYKYNPEFKAHELAVSWLNQKMTYPSYVFLNEQWQVLSPV